MQRHSGRRKVWAGLLLLALPTAILVWERLAARPTDHQELRLQTSHAGITVEKLQPLSTLTTLRVDVADAVVSELRGYIGSSKAVVVVKGDVTLGVDLGTAKFQQINEPQHTAVLVLPQPSVQTVRVDHEHTRLLGVWSSGIWSVTPGGSDADAVAINHAYRDAQRFVASAAADPQLLARARQQAEVVLSAFCVSLGWRIEVQWKR